jgi:hypothetical protein
MSPPPSWPRPGRCRPADRPVSPGPRRRRHPRADRPAPGRSPRRHELVSGTEHDGPRLSARRIWAQVRPHPAPDVSGTGKPGPACARILIETCSSGHDNRMPAPLFARKPEYCPYGHSLAPGMPQKISWLPCMCEPAREAGSQGRGLGHMTLWCGTCSAEDRRDSRFYEPPHRAGGGGPVSGWTTRPDL